MFAKAGLLYLTLCVIQEVRLEEKNPFLSIASSKFYVDKTGLIDYFHDAFKTPIFFTAPRGVGKTTNLLMLKAFFNLNQLPNGTVLEKEKTKSYEAFQKIKNTTSQRPAYTILDDQKFVKLYFGGYPVIHLSFKDLHHDRLSVFMNSLKWLMIHAFKEYRCLGESDKVPVGDRALAQKFIDEKVRRDQDIEESGGTLVRLLHKHFGKPCIVLIDDADALIIKMFTDGSTDEGFINKKMVTFMTGLLSDKKAVYRAFIAGKTRLACIHLPPDINHYQFGLHAGLTKFFGVRETEVRGLTKNANILNELGEFYRGYTVSNTTDKIYDPKTITTHLEGGKYTPRALDSIKFLEPLLEDDTIRDTLEIAVRCEEIPITDPDEVSAPLDPEELLADEPEGQRQKSVAVLEKIYKYHDDLINRERFKDYRDAQDAFGTVLKLHNFGRNALWYYLFELGYFAVTLKDGEQLRLTVPDRAVHTTLASILDKYWVNYLHTMNQTAKGYAESFMRLAHENTTLDAFADSVAFMFRQSPHRPTSERDLRSPMFAFLASRIHDYPVLELKCEDHPDGHVDMQAMQQRKFHSMKGIIVEYKYHDCENKSFGERIANKRYWSAFRCVEDHKDILRFLVIGLCLSEKNELHFTFLYASKKHDNAHKVIKTIQRWELPDVTGAR